MDLSVIIVNWNSADHLRRCLQSLYRSPSPNGWEFETIVIDNASYDQCRELIEGEYPQVHFLQSERNLGFARANNQAARQAKGRVLTFLNPDTEVEVGALRALWRAAESLPSSGAVGAKLLAGDGGLDTNSVQRFPTIFNQLLDFEVLRRRFPDWRVWDVGLLESPGSSPSPVEAVPGTSLTIRREVFDELGGFGDEYFIYTEDIDLCWKARQAGYHNYYVPKAVIVHHGGQSTGRRESSQFSNVVMRQTVHMFLKKTRGRFYAAGYRTALGAVAVLRLCFIGLLLVLGRPLKAAFRKWVSILRWTLGLEPWAKELG